MRRHFITALVCLISVSVLGQSKKEIIQQQDIQINELTHSNYSLKQEIKTLNNEIKSLKIEIESLNQELIKNLTSTPNEFGESFFKTVKYRDFNQLDVLMFSLNDTIYMSSEKQLDAIRNAREEITDDLLNLPEEISKLHTEGISIGINWSQSSFVSVEHDGIFEAHGFELLDNLKIIFESNGKTYHIKFDDNIALINNEWKLVDNDFWMIDVEEKEKKEKERLEEKERKEKQAEIDFLTNPWKPRGLYIEGANWEYRGKEFVNFNLRITNNTEFTFKKIVYHFYIKDAYRQKVYARTHTLSLSIEPKDVRTIKVPDFYDFYLGEDIANQSTWSYGVEIIDCFPHQK